MMVMVKEHSGKDGRTRKYRKLGEMLESISDHVCEDLCKYPAEYLGKYRDQDEAFCMMETEQCRFCPVRLLR